MRNLFVIFFLLPFLTKSQGIVVGDTTSSVIIYKNIKDSIIKCQGGTVFSDFDLDADTIKDIRFNIHNASSLGGTAEYEWVNSLNNLEFVVFPSDTIYLDTLAINDTLNKNFKWRKTISNVFLFKYESGPFGYTSGAFRSINHYLGFRWVKPNDTIYGWIFLNTPISFGFGDITIRSWAYQSKAVGITSVEKTNKFRSYPNPVSQFIYLELQNALSDSEIEITNYLGQTVLKTEFTNTIDVSKLATGIYTLKIIGKDDQSYYSKFVKE